VNLAQLLRQRERLVGVSESDGNNKRATAASAAGVRELLVVCRNGEWSVKGHLCPAAVEN